MHGSFADEPVELSKLPAFRAEHFPYSGPYPWLDRRDAHDRVAAKLAAGEITLEQANQCRYWAEHGYIVLERLIEESVLDEVWRHYENAIRSGKINLDPEPAGEGDPHPGRYLNPHRKLASFCRILKHPGLLGWLQHVTEPRASASGC